MNKLKGFTITETVVVLLLTVIVTGIIIGMLKIAQEAYAKNESDLLMTWKTGELYSLLQNDIFTSGSVTWENGVMSCDFPTYSVLYSFEASAVRRWASFAEGNKEQFPFTVKSVTPACIQLDDGRKVLEHLRLTVVFEEDSIVEEFQKQYNVQPLIDLSYGN